MTHALVPQRRRAQPSSLVQRRNDPLEREAQQVSERLDAGGPAPPRRLPRPAPLSHPALPTPGGGTAEPLPDDTRRRYEASLGADLSAVRVHRLPEAHAALSTRAFTYGPHIAFAPGQWQPGTADGQALLAHELAHVIQQGGGLMAAALSAAGRVGIQAEGQLTEADMEAIRAWIEADAAKDAPAEAPSRTLTAFPVLTPLQPFPADKGQPWPQFKAMGGSTLTQPGGAMAWPDRPGARFEPILPYGKPPAGAFCPGSCHQTAQEQWDAAQARKQREAAEKRERERKAAWPGMHKAQHEAEITQQPRTLSEDIATSELMLAQLRLQMFEKALRAQEGALPPLTPSAAGRLTPEMRDAWAHAEQAAMVLEALLRTATEPPPPDVAASLRKPFLAYYDTLAQAIADIDREQARADQRFAAASASAASQAPACPGGCHAPAAQPTEPRRFLMAPPAPPPLDLRMLMRSPAGTPEVAAPAGPGPGTERLQLAIRNATGAADVLAWHRVRNDFVWASMRMDEMLKSRLRASGDAKDLLEQYDFTKQVLGRQRDFFQKHPDALKVQAVFYPRHEFSKRTDEKTGLQQEIAKGIPWQFYLTRTPLANPGSREVPAGYEWQLHDITAPKRPDRTVRTRHQVTMFEALARERLDPAPISEMDPPPKLFKELNHRDFFSEGMLYWRSPITGKAGEQEMTNDKPFGEWLQLIGMAIAIVGSLVLAPYATPGLIAATVLTGTAITIAGRLHRLEEMDRHGVLTSSDVQRFFWDVGMDIVSAMTLGLGRAVQVSRAAGTLMRGGSNLERAYFFTRGVQVSMDVVNVGVVAHDFLAQYRAIQNSNMTPEEKQIALAKLTMFAMGTGAMMMIPLYTAGRKYTQGSRLQIDVDPKQPSRLVAHFEDDAAEAAGHLRTRAQADAKIVERTSFTHPATGEKHDYALWSDGRITRCSGPPCPQLAESVVNRIDEMRGRITDPDSPLGSQMQALMERARRLREDAEALAAGAKATLPQRQKGVMARITQIEADMARLEQRIADEAAAGEMTGRVLARERWGDAALDYNREHYRWVRNRRTGELSFQRRSQAVPWLKFDPARGKFVVERSLFVAAEPADLALLAEQRLSKDFKVTHTIQSVDDLNRLRPASPLAKPPRPDGWVLVKINDDNLVHFYSEPVRPGVIFEFPDGSRVWRNERNNVVTEGLVRAPIGRRGFEASTHPQLGTSRSGVSNEGVPVLESTGVPHQRAHPRGQGTGFELFNHIPLAPTYVNQQLQARGIELFISELNRVHATGGRRFLLLTEHSLIPSTRRQAWIDYHLLVTGPGGTRPMLKLRIGTDYSDAAAPAKTEIRWLTTNADDLKLLDAVDMDAARAELRAAIQRARQRRAGR